MRKLLPLFFVALISIPAVWPFLQKGFFWTQDIIYLARIQAASHALANWQFPMRWVQDFRYGEPLFNYYAPLPYYLGALIHTLGFDFITTAKIIFVLITTASGLFMYLLAKEYWGKWGGLLSAFLYIYAPYRAVDLYVRGTLSEVFAFVWFPAIFLTYQQFFKTEQKKYLWAGSLSLAFLFLTHNIMSLIFLPFFFAFVIFSIFMARKKSLIIPTLLSFFLGLGLSAFFWLPAFFEKGLVQSQKTILSLDNFVNQFVKFPDFFRPNWNGFSITHELGIIHLVFTFLTIISSIFLLKKNKKTSFPLFLLLFLLLVSLFMQSIQSLNFWLFITPLQFVQFPWRFAGISIFLISLLAGAIVYLIKSPKLQALVVSLTILLTFFIQRNYFQPPGIKTNATDKDYIILQDAYLPREYLPAGAKTDPPQKIKTPVLADSYQAITVANLIQRSNYYFFNSNLVKQEEIVVPIYYFPGWKAFNYQQEITLKRQLKTGLILFPVPPNKQEIYLKFTDTPLRRWSNIVSLISLIALIFLWSNFRQKSSA